MTDVKPEDGYDLLSPETLRDLLRDLVPKAGTAQRVIRRMLYGWRPSVTHRVWFRSTALDTDTDREPMTDEEAAVIDHVYSRSNGDGTERDDSDD